MAHPGRGRINTRHSYRSIPRREEVRLLNRQSTVIAFVPDASYSDVDFSDAQAVVNLQNESRTWKLPRVQLTGITPVTGYRIRTVLGNTLWEVLKVNRPSDEMFHCVTVRMNEHDEVIP